MKKSETIAACLVNSGFFHDQAEAELSVKKIFQTEFPNDNFAVWNAELPDSASSKIIDGVGRASRINVRKFIEDLW